MHDNVNIPVKVYAQWVDYKNHFDNGTAITILPLPVELGPLLDNTTHWRKLANWIYASDQPTLSWQNIFDKASETAPQIKKQCLHHIVTFLFNQPEMEGFKKSIGSDSALDQPPVVDQLPIGVKNRTTVAIENCAY